MPTGFILTRNQNGLTCLSSLAGVECPDPCLAGEATASELCEGVEGKLSPFFTGWFFPCDLLAKAPCTTGANMLGALELLFWDMSNALINRILCNGKHKSVATTPHQILLPNPRKKIVYTLVNWHKSIGFNTFSAISKHTGQRLDRTPILAAAQHPGGLTFTIWLGQRPWKSETAFHRFNAQVCN